MGRNKQARVPPVPEPPRPQPPPSRSRIKSAWSFLITVGSIGGLVTLVESAWSVLLLDTVPTVRALSLSPDAFSLPFVVKNPSKFFSMKEVTWTCGIDNVGDARTGITGIGLSYGSPQTILPERTLLVRCPIGGASNSDATITAIIRYKTFGINREFGEASFTWLSKATPPQWIDGSPLRP